ncbi:Protein of unknown function DUF305 [Trichormus variabilis ATCC 29413]|uniref:DUF305 domain-containing protein n=2 Tax=Anabaena variabilis TaxID=264691 RepID=Q3MAT8_TRIV2|nr:MULTISPECIES: DUF305 domain-containing protein [Nostocaceae]ABA21898.1 Protein of unknown function DUF305 [Trichormus variabilis ATCC 29413]MBC1213405.1 DUF305 domain-containing protein [Trichormus variabilis ARAD]MBC1258075.1 DUF305 domain-containing protein [Trichormus variabilis V5]MBC1269729.1 DUF305 domain-containing protein [Trichormus variabilis FSR]MBC1302397.1 DUF305 domain-containing protein [Trichormus variabilis N2B]
MQRLYVKNRFLAFSFVVMTSLSGGVLSACSTTSQAQNETPKATVTDANNQQQHHDHSMDMDLGPADADYELRFIDAMIMHHQGAVDMAKEAQQKSKRTEIKQLGTDIIKAQNQEIAQMKQWRTAWYPKAGDQPMAYDAKMGHMMAMSPQQQQAMMMSMNLGTADAEFDLRFINAMIPHHEGAVVMAQDALQKSQRSEIKKLAQAIIKAQKGEIQQMEQWRKAWYNQ